MNTIERTVIRIIRVFRRSLLITSIMILGTSSIAQENSKQLRILFLGTMLNNIPEWFATICQDLDVTQVVTTTISRPYFDLERHSSYPDTLSAIRKGGWGAIVLQAFPTEALSDYQKFAIGAEKLSNEIKSSGANLFYFETWAVQKGGKHDDIFSQEWSGGDSFSMQSRLSDVYEKVTSLTGGRVVPVGDAWEKTVREHPEIILSQDGIHASGCGMYLSACVFVCAIMNQDPRKSKWVPSYKVTQNEAEILREIAYNTVFQE